MNGFSNGEKFIALSPLRAFWRLAYNLFLGILLADQSNHDTPTRVYIHFTGLSNLDLHDDIRQLSKRKHVNVDISRPTSILLKAKFLQSGTSCGLEMTTLIAIVIAYACLRWPARSEQRFKILIKCWSWS
eukprot:g17226.t1